jgi:hypothetical protein
MKSLRSSLLSTFFVAALACSNEVEPNDEPVIKCASETGSTACTCTVTTPGSATPPDYATSYACGGTTLICCEAAGYPSSGSCSCYASWRCVNEGSSCNCALGTLGGTGAPPVSSCDDSNAQGCCFFDDGTASTCTCAPGPAACSSSELQVTECSNPAPLGVAALSQCPAGTRQVTDCSP